MRQRALDALQAALAAEHEAVYVYGVLGARSTGPLRESLGEQYVAHRARRDAWSAAVLAAGAEPVGTAAAYALPRPLTTPAQCRAEAVRIEEHCSAASAFLIAAGPDSLRGPASVALNFSAVAAVRFGGDTSVLPGVRS
ncbi:unannotated protein [freshwater metagenome]|uniref:Unannotated protein n=1 Tax=freshwater metagenome TaxID=449393 RepID=A0A6J6RPK1_9ZZZZ